MPARPCSWVWDGPQAAQAAGADAEAAVGASVRETDCGRGQDSYNSSKRMRVAANVTAGTMTAGETAGAARAATAATVATAAAIAARRAEVAITTADATARAAAGAGEAGQPPPKPADWDNMTRKQRQHWHKQGGKWR